MRLFVNCYLLLLVACLAVYLPSLWNGFQLGWDDQWYVMNRYTEDGFTQANLRAVFTDFYYGQYSPVNVLANMAMYAAFGYKPFVFHLYSLLLHIACCFLLFAFLSRMGAIFNCTLCENPLRSLLVHVRLDFAAFAATLLFAIHPLQVESICWISAAKIPLYTLFTLLAMFAYLRYVRAGKMLFYFAAFGCFLLAFGSKEQAIALPALLLLLDWALGRHRSAEGKNNWMQLIFEKLPFILFAIFAALYTRSHQSMEYTAQVAGYPLWQRLVFACYSLVVYAGRFALPANLLYVYPFPMPPGDALPAQYFVYPVVVAAGVYLLFLYFRKIPRVVVFGLLFYLVNMALVLHIVPMSRFMITADRYVYLGSAGLFFIAAWYTVPWLQKVAAAGKKWIFAVVACYLLYLGGYAHVRSYAWKDSDTVKKDLWELIEKNKEGKHEPDNDEDI